MNNPVKKSLAIGTSGVFAMLALYFIAVSLISDTAFTVGQFKKFWYYIIPLALGFGAQLALYMYLRQAVRQTNGSGKVLAVSGGTSGVAMITCCAHYLANIAPLIVTAGVVTFLTQYQVQFLWVGLLFNIAGVAYIWKKIRAHSHYE